MVFLARTQQRYDQGRGPHLHHPPHGVDEREIRGLADHHEIRLFQRDSYLSVDYAAQEAERWRLVRGASAMPAIDGGKLEVATEEPLKRELADFVAAVAEKRAPGVPGADGLRALELAQRITDAMKEQETLG